MADFAKQFPQPPAGKQSPDGKQLHAGKQSTANVPDLWDQLFAQALKIETAELQSAGPSTSTGLQTASDDIPQAESLQGEEKSGSLYIQDAEVLAARNSASAMTLLWERVAPLIRGMVDITLNHHRHVRKEDLQQEAWIAFAQSVERYDGRSRGAYWTYLRLSLHTRFRQFAAHDRVIPIPHDTRQQRAHWHKITQETFDARLQAQNLSYPDAETEGWNTIMKGGGNNMEDAVIEKMDINTMRRKLQCLPRRWRDLLLLAQKYENQDLALLLDIDLDEMVRLQTQVSDILKAMPIEYFSYGKSESEYLADWDKLRE
ncbi:hypothetical protein NRY68_16230 [Acidithiobacillus ferrooxidans]|uniref:hypothetical protein n=1 Tax=Acidithiobacillus ferrooxidans TaxID=920 RepID=UPI0021478978|nr:hypothetical protein [Acidithiobacillus ferrooxidans]MCR1347298.1 hypothetical protein [Acidithiobacillus ferrooxidans]MCR1354841.1 hypothetical protein [Acidithiobacillus ferrooxidans]